jgi:hypothetical protein
MSEPTEVLTAGSAVYLELERFEGRRVHQVFFTSQGVTKRGKSAPPMMLMRTLTPTRTRSKWGVQSVTTQPVSGDTYTNAVDALSVADKTISQFMHFLRQVSDQGYTVRKQPIYLAVSGADLDELISGKTPYKLLGRMERTRKVLNFPEELLREVGV